MQELIWLKADLAEGRREIGDRRQETEDRRQKTGGTGNERGSRIQQLIINNYLKSENGID
ncbi:MAG: hypothetical protein F6K39_31365 [Okeania sp. SIO3B3]|nr:hypothetical protein [Okeania sp. SIO3B3]